MVLNKYYDNFEIIEANRTTLKLKIYMQGGLLRYINYPIMLKWLRVRFWHEGQAKKDFATRKADTFSIPDAG